MDEQVKSGKRDYEADCKRLGEQNRKMSIEIQDMKQFFEAQRRENEIMKAKLEMVYLIFGGR